MILRLVAFFSFRFTEPTLHVSQSTLVASNVASELCSELCKFIFCFHHPRRQKIKHHFLILLVEMHVYDFNRKSKVFKPWFYGWYLFMSAGTLTLPIRKSILYCKTGGMSSSASAKTNFLIYHPTGNKFVFLMLHSLTQMHVFSINRKSKVL